MTVIPRTWTRWVHSAAILAGVLLLLVLWVSHRGRGTPAPPSPAPAASSTPNITTRSAPALRALAARYVAAYKVGRKTGGEEWRAQLRAVASPELVKTVSVTDPQAIPTADIREIVVEEAAPNGTGLVRVTLDDDDWLLLHTAPNAYGLPLVVAVELSDPGKG